MNDFTVFLIMMIMGIVSIPFLITGFFVAIIKYVLPYGLKQAIRLTFSGK